MTTHRQLDKHNRRVNHCRRSMATILECDGQVHPSRMQFCKPRSDGYRMRGKHGPGWRTRRMMADSRHQRSLACQRHQHRLRDALPHRTATAFSALTLLRAMAESQAARSDNGLDS